MSNERPLIGITMRHELETERFYLARYYCEAIEAAGGIPVHVPLIPRKDYIETLMSKLDGVLLPGSASDVDPLRYGEEPHTKLGSVHPLRDETDWLILDVLERMGTPLLAICFGLQVWNVHRGGTLIQDINAQVPGALKHEQGAPRERPSHRVRLADESGLAELAGRSELLVNSHHHQAIATVGRDLIAAAWSSDGLIEAVEDARGGRWAKGVQWHPEMAWEDAAFSLSLFASFVAATREFGAGERENRGSLSFNKEPRLKRPQK
jgi:putative glutamine amidotransferase